MGQIIKNMPGDRENFGGNKEVTVMELEVFVHESLEKLQKLGIDALEAEENIVNQFHSMPQDMVGDMESEEIFGLMLGGIASGFYPGTEQAASKIYAFDMEVPDTLQMYTSFLEGISRIAEGELEITDIEEVISEEELEAGTGTQIVRFCCNGKAYEYEAEYYYDWFDARMLAFMNQVIAEQDTGRCLYVASDGYQECIVFYRTEEWAEQFRRELGVELDRP
ncbi:MAG: hypothetical protein HDR02_03920 [Lachnospiraceae bacterium]|nr:hypothetical protein [Lachnospiraceae bacterium]